MGIAIDCRLVLELLSRDWQERNSIALLTRPGIFVPGGKRENPLSDRTGATSTGVRSPTSETVLPLPQLKRFLSAFHDIGDLSANRRDVDRAGELDLAT